MPDASPQLCSACHKVESTRYLNDKPLCTGCYTDFYRAGDKIEVIPYVPSAKKVHIYNEPKQGLKGKIK